MAHPFLELLIAESNRFQREPYCPRCGNSLIFIDTTFWMYGDEKACTTPLPVCSACESEAHTEAGPHTRTDLSVSTTASQTFNSSKWKQAYIAALFETDKNKVNSLIMVAETAIVLRARELFAVEGDHSGEKAALNAALLSLHSLRGVRKANNSACWIRAANDLAV